MPTATAQFLNFPASDMQAVSFFGKRAWDTFICHQRSMFDISFPPRALDSPEPAAGAIMAIPTQAKD